MIRQFPTEQRHVTSKITVIHFIIVSPVVITVRTSDLFALDLPVNPYLKRQIVRLPNAHDSQG